MPGQILWKTGEGYGGIDSFLADNHIKSIFLVCDGAIGFLEIDHYFRELPDRLGIAVERFMEFQPNPQYESVVEGVRRFRERRRDAVFAVGGGSAMDVAKCIKLYADMDSAGNYLEQPIIPNDIPLFAVPTTAGTGSEATKYAVIYYNDKKQSIADDNCIPAAVFLDADVLRTLPSYQKKSTMLDAFCHAIESFWSIHSTEESRAYAAEALRLILADLDSYLANEGVGNANMLYAAHLAGKAINITQTTAGHAMCYKLTSLYGIAHGHAAALCVDALWPYMLEHTGDSVDSRGEHFLKKAFSDLGHAMGCSDATEAARMFHLLLQRMEIYAPAMKDREDMEILVHSVNPVRLKNNPVRLSGDSIRHLYQKILHLEETGLDWEESKYD